MNPMNPKSMALFAVCSAALLVGVPAAASPREWQADGLSKVMARQVAAVARHPSDVSLLIASGRTALQLGDSGAAAGFFGRARELAPENASAHLGMASTLVALNRPDAALVEFARARQLGSSPSLIAADLGLAYDLIGNQSKAEAEYLAGLNGPDAAQTRRRLALSLAIAGNQHAAATILEPLLAAGDRPALLTRAFVLALSGDIAGSTAALNEISPGTGSAAEPFLGALPSLSAGEKAATLNLGIFPTRISIVEPADQEGLLIHLSDKDGAAAKPMEYGGTPKKPRPATLRQQEKAELALYGVFPDR